MSYSDIILITVVYAHEMYIILHIWTQEGVSPWKKNPEIKLQEMEMMVNTVGHNDV